MRYCHKIVQPVLLAFVEQVEVKFLLDFLLTDDVQNLFFLRRYRGRLGKNDVLTTTEKQILRLICADKSNGEIAQMMDIKLTTVKTHVSHILEKLDVNRRSEAKTAAKRLKLIPEE